MPTYLLPFLHWLSWSTSKKMIRRLPKPSKMESSGTPVAKVMYWRARGGVPKVAPQMWPDVYPSRPQKGPSAGTPRIGLGALLGQTRPWEILNLTIVAEVTHQERAGQKADAEIRDLGSIFGVHLGGLPGACFMTFWGPKMGLLFEALELLRGARK